MSFSDVGGNNSTSFNSKLATSQPANWPDLLPVGEKCPTKAEEAKKSSLLEETLMGLQEVSELLQQSLLDIRKEGSVKGGASNHLSRGRSESDRLRRRSDSHVMTSSARLGQTPAAALMREINGGGNRLMTSLKKIPDTKFPAPSSR